MPTSREKRRASWRSGEECHDCVPPEFCAPCCCRLRGRCGFARDRATAGRQMAARRRAFRRASKGLWGASPTVAKLVNEMSDGKFVIDTFAAGEIVPGLQVLDAVANGTVECGHTYSGYYIGKNPALIFDGSLPFGFTARQHNAWYMFGDGKKLIDEIYDAHGRRQHSDGQHRRTELRLVPQGDQIAGGLQRHQDARRGLRRTRDGEARRHPAADRGRRYLSGAGEGHDRRRRMGRPVRRREARLPQGRQIHAHPGRARAVCQQLPVHQQGQMGRSCRPATRRCCAPHAPTR